MDNTIIKDGMGNQFNLRARDVAPAQDGSLRRSMTFSTLFPIDYGAGGSYHRTTKSGSMAAGLAAGSPIYAFQFTSGSLLALIRRLRISAWSLGTGFTAGVATFDMLTARPFTAQLTGGTAANLAGNNAKLRTSMGSATAAIQCSSTAALAGGTYTLDPGPGVTDSWAIGAPTTINTAFAPGSTRLFDKPLGEMPLLLAQNEGFIIQATMPATGIWGFMITPEWEEVPLNIAGY